jgi:hypothetical protein
MKKFHLLWKSWRLDNVTTLLMLADGMFLDKEDQQGHWPNFWILYYWLS